MPLKVHEPFVNYSTVGLNYKLNLTNDHSLTNYKSKNLQSCRLYILSIWLIGTHLSTKKSSSGLSNDLRPNNQMYVFLMVCTCVSNYIVRTDLWLKYLLKIPSCNFIKIFYSHEIFLNRAVAYWYI